MAGTTAVPLSQGKHLLEQHRTGSVPTELETSEAPTPMLQDAQSPPPYSPAKSAGERVEVGGQPVARSLEPVLNHETMKGKVRGMLEGFSIAQNLLDLQLTPEEMEQVLDDDFTPEEKSHALMFWKTFRKAEDTLSNLNQQLDAMKRSGGDPSEIAALEKKIAYATASEEKGSPKKRLPPPKDLPGKDSVGHPPKDVPKKDSAVEPKNPKAVPMDLEVADSSEAPQKNCYWQFLVLNTCCS